jgi:hypothetical protein
MDFISRFCASALPVGVAFWRGNATRIVHVAFLIIHGAAKVATRKGESLKSAGLLVEKFSPLEGARGGAGCHLTGMSLTEK